jgi:SAM-dependent methyltransferase
MLRAVMAAKRHADEPFLVHALTIGDVVYSFHNAETEAWVERRIAELGYPVTLTDISEGMLRVAEQKLAKANLLAKVRIIAADVTEMDMFGEGSFDFVLCEGDPLSYCRDPRKGIKELVNRSREIMKDARYYEERRTVQEFLRHLGEDDGLGTYGEQEVMQALKGVNVQLLLISEEVRRTLYRLRCKSCGYVESKVVDNEKVEEFEANLSQVKCLKCGGDVEDIWKKRTS